MTPSSPIVDPRVRALLRDAAQWRLLSRLFECPGEPWRRDVAALAAEVDDPVLRAAAEAAVATATEGEYHSVFGPGGPAPAREASYYDSVELGSLMSDLAARYEAFAYRPSSIEAPDHVAVEAGFMAYLRLKEAYAIAAGEEDHAAVTAEAAGRFKTDHLAMFSQPLATLLADSGIEYLMLAAGRLAESAGRRPRPAQLPVIPAPLDDESEFPCSEP